MKVILYILILLLMLSAPVTALDVAKLQPVQTVAVSMRDDQISVETDTGSVGIGTDLNDALLNLEKVTPGVIYLDTAEYLLLTQDTSQYANDFLRYLHPSVRVSFWDGEGSVEDAAKYLAVRRDLPKLRYWEKE